MNQFQSVRKIKFEGDETFLQLENIAKVQNSALKAKMKDFQTYEDGAVDFFK